MRQTNLAILDHEAVVDTRLEHLEHLRVLHVVANMFKDVAVRYHAEGTEDDPDGNVDFDVGNRGLHDIAELECECQYHSGIRWTVRLTERSWLR